MATQKGIGVVWGIGTSNLTTTGTGILRPNRQGLSDTQETSEHRDENGEVKGVTLFNRTKTVTLDVYPAGATLANAAAALTNRPAPGDVITLVDSTDTQLAGDYLVTGVEVNKEPTSKVAFTITAIRHSGVSSYTTISS